MNPHTQNRKTAHAALIAGLILLFLCLAGCGGKSDNGTSQPQKQAIHMALSKMQKESKLKVYYMRDEEPIYHSKQDDNSNIDSLLWAVGEGYYLVDLSQSEFLIDEVHQSVLVRTPDLDLEDFSIRSEDYKVVLFDKNGFNGAYIEGVKLAMSDVRAAYCVIRDKMTVNQDYYNGAVTAAETLIKNLVHGLSDVPLDRITVEIGVM